MKLFFLVVFSFLFVGFLPQESDFEYNYTIYSQKEAIDIESLVLVGLYSKKEAKLEDSKTFLYKNSEEQICIAIYKKAQWHSWEIYDAMGQVYFASIEQKDFDGIGNPEILIQSKYGLDLQSTFGSSYDGAFQIWNTDEVELYFEINNYEYADDMGRNGDNQVESECFLTAEVSQKEIKVSSKSPLDKGCFLAEIVNELAGQYLLVDGVVVKK